MISLILFALGRQSDIASDLESALAGKQLSGPAFHQAIDPVLDRYEALKTARFEHTIGDSRGMIVTLNGSGPNWDSTKAWRIFLWPENGKIRAQVIKRFGDFSTSAIDSYTVGDNYWRNDRLVIVGKDYDGTPTSRAGLTSYIYSDARWKLDQHLSSERQGVAAFATLAKSVDPLRIIVRTRLRPDNFRISSDGPMLTFTETWLFKNGRYVQGKPQQEDTAVSFLDRIIGLVHTNKRDSFNNLVAKPYQDMLWRCFSQPDVSISTPATDADGSLLFSVVNTPFAIGVLKVASKWTVCRVLQR